MKVKLYWINEITCTYMQGLYNLKWLHNLFSMSRMELFRPQRIWSSIIVTGDML